MIDSLFHRQRIFFRTTMLICSGMLIGCSADIGPIELERIEIEAVREDWGVVGRSIIKCPAGDCIILHFPPTPGYLELQTKEKVPLSESIRITLNAEASDPGLHGRLVPLGERWGGNDIDDVYQATFNCCTYALGELLDLRAGDWLDTERRYSDSEHIPIQVVLDSFFDEVCRFDVDHVDWNALNRSTQIQHGDLLCFVRTAGKKYSVSHVGIARSTQHGIRMESKLGVGPVVEATLEATSKSYPMNSDCLMVFRLRPEFRRPGLL